jgi:putative ABC transport system permease protein
MSLALASWLKFAALNTLRNRRRSLVTVGIAALGTAALLLAGGFALTTYQSLEQAAARDSGHLVIGTPAQLQAAHPALKVQTWLERAVFYKSVRALYNRLFGVMGLVIGVIVLFVVAGAMALAVIERTRETGTLRALGMLPRQLLRTLALEGLLLGGAGALAGALLALAVSGALLVFPVQMPPPPGRSSGYPLRIAIEPALYLYVPLLVLKLSTLAATLVAWRTVRRPVVEALAHV